MCVWGGGENKKCVCVGGKQEMCVWGGEKVRTRNVCVWGGVRR